MASLLSVRVKSAKANTSVVLRDLDPTMPTSHFLALVAEKMNMNPRKMSLLQGFPPHNRIILGNMIDPSAGLRLADLEIKHQDTILVQEDPNPSPPPLEVPAVLAAKPTNAPGSPSPSADSGTGAGGIVMRKVVPADNSCLFRSVMYTMAEDQNGQLYTNEETYELRCLIAATVLSCPEEYNEAFLGRSPEEYAAWIQKQDSWGGGIELSILASYFSHEIVVMDVQHGRFHRFGEDKEFDHRVFLIYDGIHYDPLYWDPLDGSDNIVTKFPNQWGPNDPEIKIFELVMELGLEAKKNRQYTDTKNFQLRCRECNEKIAGDLGARDHAKITNHQFFDEVLDHNYY